MSVEEIAISALVELSQEPRNFEIDKPKNKCQYTGCDRSPTWFKSDNKVYCWKHRTKSMVNLHLEMCTILSCTMFAEWGDGYSITHCTDHKSNEMFYMRNYRTKKCEEHGCNYDAKYKYPQSNEKTYCQDHQKPGMIFSGRICAHAKCDTHASFGYKNNGVKMYCRNHKLQDMVAIKVYHKKPKYFKMITVNKSGDIREIKY